MALLDSSRPLAARNENGVPPDLKSQQDKETSPGEVKSPTISTGIVPQTGSAAIPAKPPTRGNSEGSKEDLPPKSHSDAGAPDLFKIIDAQYGYPIGSIKTEDIAKSLKEIGFTGRGPIRDPNGLPDIPEAKELVSWELECEIDGSRIIAELLGDSRGQLRTIQLSFLNSKVGGVTSFARSNIVRVLSELKAPGVTLWLQRNIGTKDSTNLEGMSVECYAPTAFGHLIDIKGIKPVAGVVVENSGSSTSEKGTANPFAMREWTDKSGKFKVTAYFVKKNGSKIKLRKKDHSSIEVEIDILSPADQEFVAGIKR